MANLQLEKLKADAQTSKPSMIFGLASFVLNGVVVSAQGACTHVGYALAIRLFVTAMMRWNRPPELPLVSYWPSDGVVAG